MGPFTASHQSDRPFPRPTIPNFTKESYACPKLGATRGASGPSLIVTGVDVSAIARIALARAPGYNISGLTANPEVEMVREAKMKRFSPLAFAFALLIAFCGPLFAQSKQELPIPGGPVATDIPGAKERPDPKIVYKVVFDIAKAAPKVDEVNPGLTGVVRYLNTLAANGVPADHRKIAVVFHQDGTDIVMNNDAFKARYEGHDNPDIALIHEMKKAGVDFRVCGQAVLAHKIDPKTINPDIELDLWALTTLINLQTRGYIHIGGN